MTTNKPRGGKRAGAGRKSLKEQYGEDVIELTVRLSQSQYNHVSKQAQAAASYIRHLIDRDMSR